MSGTVEGAIQVEGESLGRARGARVEVDCVDVIEVRDGLVASKQTYLDSLASCSASSGVSDGYRDPERQRRTEKADAAEAWVEMFAEGWAHPVDADSFCDHFDPWLDDEVRMIQPSLRPVVGKRGFREEFARPLFELVPDLHGTVESWSATRDVAYIELRLEGTVGRRRFTHAHLRPDQAPRREGGRAPRLSRRDAPGQSRAGEPPLLAHASSAAQSTT